MLRPLVAALIAALALPGCYWFRFGGNPDRTVYEQVPEDVPAERWIQGTPRLAVEFEGAFRIDGKGRSARDPHASDYYLRLLRKTGLFGDVRLAEPDVAARPDPGGVRGARVRLLLDYREDSHSAGDLVKAALTPGLTAYKMSLDGTQRLELSVPWSEQVVSYEARSVLTRLYYQSGRATASRQILHDEADRLNFLAIVHRMRSDPLLFQPGGSAKAD